MSPETRTGGRMGGLSALFFLGTLGGIAFYVQRQSVQDEREVVRKSVSVVAQDPAQDGPPALPWEDRLNLADARLVPIVTPGAATAPAPEAAAAADGASSAAPDPDGKADPKPDAGPVDPATARLVQELSDGHRILLTLDPVLQDSAMQIFRGREVPYAAAVMLDLTDNSVLVLAGHSSMDPEVDPLEIVATAWAPAASTFKLVTSAALLDAQDATPSTRVCFSGGLHGIDDAQLRDDSKRDTQCATLSAAVAHSYNLVIGKLALRHLSQEDLVGMARALKYEADIPFEFPVERSPIHIPEDAVDRAKVAAGFWNVDQSPIHGALMASIFARRGHFQAPHLIAQVLGPDGTDLTPARPKVERVLDKKVAGQVGEMMVGTTKDGTARNSFWDDKGNPYVAEMKVAGKTGSLTGRRAPALNYNWFVGYAPADKPEIAFAVLLANEPKWKIKAHYAARRLVQLYIQRREDIARARRARLQGQTLIIEDPTAQRSGSSSNNAPAAAAAAALPPVPGPDAKGT